LINLGFVTAQYDNNVIVGDKALQVSRNKKKDLLNALNVYLNEVSK
jgi:predicted solute-binding protein